MEGQKMKKEDGIELRKRTADGKIAYLIKPILKVLQDAGGQLERSDIKERIADLDDQIAEYAEGVKKSKKTGNVYKEFDFKFNFAIKNLLFTELVTFSYASPVVLTEKGENIDLDKLDVWAIIEDSKKHWEEQSKNRKKKDFDLSDSEEETQAEEKIKDDFKERLLAAIGKMSPKKFEAFSRALLNKMGVEFTEKGVQVSNDGGIDGYGYHVDRNDFRTTRVVIQCKRYNVGPVSEPEINQFLGAMNKYQADYGVFITNGRFTSAARVAAKEGSPITLIDGNELVRLVIRYELYIKPVQTYVLDEFYDSNE
jgi:restriction system protein